MDPAIKLFGKTIPLQDTPLPPPDLAGADVADSVSTGAGEDLDCCDEAPSCEMKRDNKLDNGSRALTSRSQETTNPNENPMADDNSKTPAADNEAPASKTSKTEEEQSETGNSQEKTLKKPDKILPCPRCNSMETKFCYYNNYNVNQPRHFCKNCQRYWTAGGTMRNVPVGAGRRKNKNSASQFRQITVSEALHNAQVVDLPNGTHYPILRPNGTVLTFGSDTPLCESMASVLIAEKKNQIGVTNGVHKPEHLKISVPYKGGENGDDNSNSIDNKNGSKDFIMQNCHSLPSHVPVFPGPPWPYPLNSAQWVPPPGFCPPGFPMPFYPAPPYWGCSVPSPWSIPWVSPPPSSTSHTAISSGPNSPTLGKHSREENVIKPTELGKEEEHKYNSSERSLWIPKTLRIDDPGEAAKSSIWATLGIKHEKCDSTPGGGLFKAFHSKAERRDNSETFPALKANPAAFSRSQNFQESS